MLVVRGVLAPYRFRADIMKGNFLGPRDERQAEKAHVDPITGKWVGGIRWERSPLAYNLAKANRCYTLGQSYQHPRNLTGPAVGAKVDDKVMEHQVQRQEVLEVGAQIT